MSGSVWCCVLLRKPVTEFAPEPSQGTTDCRHAPACARRADSFLLKALLPDQLEATMQVVYHICCGIDVHAKFLVACLLQDGKKEIRRFSTNTSDLVKLRDWLFSAGCSRVAIESTGVYWKPVFNILEPCLKVILVNPEHVRALRGRKTDVKDCVRLAELLSVDLLQPSFIPPAHIRHLRELTRYRESLVRTRAAMVNRIQKVIESGNIKLAQVASDVMGASGRAMLRALAAGETEAGRLAELAKGKLKQKRAELQQALDGQMNQAQCYVLGELLDRVKELEAALMKVNSQIQQAISDKQHPELLEGWQLLQDIPGYGPVVAEVVIAEIGVNMREVFPTAGHLCSWAGVCPGNKATGGKRLSGKTRRANRYLRSVLIEASCAASRKKESHLSAMYGRLVRRLGKKKTLMAVAHALLVITYHVLDRKQPYKELGADYYERQQPSRQRAYLVRRLESLGYKVSLEELTGAA